MPQRSPSPKFYRVIAVLFFLIGAVLLWWTIKSHEWFIGAFAVVTLLNGCMATLKSFVMAESGK